MVIHPLLKVVVFIVIFLFIIYVFQHFFNINLSNYFGPFGKYLDTKNWNLNFYGIPAQAGKYIKNILKIK